MTYSELKNVISIDQVCELFSIKHRGKQYHCPFHADKSPSASIKGDKFHCFSCGFHGDIFDLSKALGMDTETLAKAFGYEFKTGKIDRKELERIKKERAEKERKHRLAAWQQQRLSECRRWFWCKTFDDDFFPIVVIDRIFEQNNFPLGYDVEAMIRGLYLRWKDEMKAR